jgi:hypothetical protein
VRGHGGSAGLKLPFGKIRRSGIVDCLKAIQRARERIEKLEEELAKEESKTVQGYIKDAIKSSQRDIANNFKLIRHFWDQAAKLAPK